MRDASKIPLAIVGAGVLVAVSILWAGARIERHLERRIERTTAEAQPEGREPPGAPTRDPRPPTVGPSAMPPRAVGDAHEAVPGGPAGSPGQAHDERLTQEAFSAVWNGPAREEAEAKCFRPLDEAGEAVIANPYFTVVVDERGRVTDVRPEQTERGADLYACVGDIVKTLELAPGPRREGFVQAGRPPAH